MESKLNFKAIETYAKAYSAKLLDDIFVNKEHVSGDDILKLPVSQVGLLILDEIYQSWSLEAEKLRSNYFNYEAEEVKAGMRKLMNLLSKNILVPKPYFEPLLIKAVKDTLLLILSPYSYYEDLLNQETLTLEQLKGKAKFIKINSSVLGRITDILQNNPELINEIEPLLDKVFGSSDDEPDNNDDVLKAFAELHPLTIDDFYLEQEGSTVLHNKEFEEDEDELEEETEATLNASFMGNSYETVADKLKNSQQASSIKSMLSINQKFMFINDLFDGSQEDFTKVLDFLEACETIDVAKTFIQNNYLKHNKWKENSPQVKEFMLLLNKKFGIG